MVKGRLVKLQLWDTAGQEPALLALVPRAQKCSLRAARQQPWKFRQFVTSDRSASP